MGKPIQEAVTLVAKAKRELNKLLGGPEHVHNLLSINQHFDRISARLGFMGGVIEQPIKDPGATDPHPPITKFMGETIVRETKITSFDLNPREAEKNAFLAKVDKLFAEIGTLNAQAILNSYTRPEDIMVLRGVAKRAGVDGFEDKPITFDFIEEIQMGVELKKEETQTQSLIDSAKKETKTILTQEVIDADPELKKWKAAPGDELVISEEGSRKLNKAKKE